MCGAARPCDCDTPAQRQPTVARTASALARRQCGRYRPEKGKPLRWGLVITGVSRRQVLLGASSLAVAACAKSEQRSSGARVIRVGMLRISPHLMAPRFYSRFLPVGLEVETLAFNNSTEIK